MTRRPGAGNSRLLHPVLRIPFRAFYRATIRNGRIVEAPTVNDSLTVEPIPEFRYREPWQLTSDERLTEARKVDPDMRWMDIVPIHRAEVLGAIGKGYEVPVNVREEYGI